MTAIPRLAAASWLPDAVANLAYGPPHWVSRKLDGQGATARATAKADLNTISATADALAGVSQDQTDGMNKLAAQAALKRIKNKVKITA